MPGPSVAGPPVKQHDACASAAKSALQQADSHRDSDTSASLGSFVISNRPRIALKTFKDASQAVLALPNRVRGNEQSQAKEAVHWTGQGE